MEKNETGNTAGKIKEGDPVKILLP